MAHRQGQYCGVGPGLPNVLADVGAPVSQLASTESTLYAMYTTSYHYQSPNLNSIYPHSHPIQPHREGGKNPAIPHAPFLSPGRNSGGVGTVRACALFFPPKAPANIPVCLRIRSNYCTPAREGGRSMPSRDRCLQEAVRSNNTNSTPPKCSLHSHPIVRGDGGKGSYCPENAGPTAPHRRKGPGAARILPTKRTAVQLRVFEARKPSQMK